MWEKSRSKPPDAVFSRGTPPRAMFGARDLFLGRDEDVGGADMLPSVPYTLCENPAGRSVLSATAGLVGPEIHRVVSAPEASAGLAPMWTSAGPQRTSRAPARSPASCACQARRSAGYRLHVHVQDRARTRPARSGRKRAASGPRVRTEESRGLGLSALALERWPHLGVSPCPVSQRPS